MLRTVANSIWTPCNRTEDSLGITLMTVALSMLPSTKLPECPHVTTTHSHGCVCVFLHVCVCEWQRDRAESENTCLWTQFDFTWHLCAWHTRGSLRSNPHNFFYGYPPSFLRRGLTDPGTQWLATLAHPSLQYWGDMHPGKPNRLWVLGIQTQSLILTRQVLVDWALSQPLTLISRWKKWRLERWVPVKRTGSSPTAPRFNFQHAQGRWLKSKESILSCVLHGPQACKQCMDTPAGKHPYTEK